jgi:hypothetical protein
MLVNSGKDVIVDRLLGNNAIPQYMGFGSGVGSVAAADTQLFVEVARVTGTPTQQTTNTTGDTFRVVGTYTASGNVGLTNVGLWTNATMGQGDLFTKSTYAVINLSSGDQLEITYNTIFVASGV